MGVYVVGILVALVTAVAVIAVANRGSDERTGWRTFLADFRAGWRDRRTSPDPAELVDVPFDELFAAESAPGDDYLQLDEFADLIERTGDRAGQLWHRDGLEQLPAQDRGPWTVHPRGHRTGPHRTGGSRGTGGGSGTAGEAPEGGSPRRTSISSPH